MNGKFAVQYVLESRDISNEIAFFVGAKKWVIFVLNQYKSYAGGRFFDQVFTHVENLFELHKKDIKKIFLALTENKTKKVTNFNDFFDMQRTADLPDGELKTNIFSIFLQFCDLETLDNKKYFIICKESPSVVIKLLIFARENLKEEFLEHFKKYAEDETISKSMLNDESLEFADMACENSDEDITKFLLRQSKIQSRTKKLMIPTICKFGLHECLELCFNEYQYLITEDHVFYFKHLLQTNYNNSQYTENIDKCLMVLANHDELITERDFMDFVLNEDQLKEVFQLVRIAQTSKVQYPVFKLLEDFFGMTYQNKSVLDDLDSNVLAAFLRDRINILTGNLITVNYNFLFDDFADHSNTIRSESLKPLKKIANTEHLQHLIQHPVLELFINESYWKFQIISLVHSGIYFLLLAMLFWGTHTQNFWFYLWLPLYVLFREIFQYNFSKEHHFASVTNWFELVIIFCGFFGTIAILVDNNEAFNLLSSVLVLLATTGLLLLMKNTNSSLFLNMSMFAQVNKSFIKTLVMFASILIAYSFVFHLLWTMHTPENSLQFSQFQVFPPLKVLMMLIGDFDTANVGILHWDQLIFYGSFVCLAVPFINFISALAIGDVQVILIGNLFTKQNYLKIEFFIVESSKRRQNLHKK